MKATSPIRWGTDLITFSNTEFWGLGKDLAHEEWLKAFHLSPRVYFEQMFDIAAKAGLDGVEFAPAPADWRTALRAFGSVRALRDAVQSRGLVVSSSYSPGMLVAEAIDDESARDALDAQMDEHARFVAELGADIIVIGNLPRSRFGYDSPDESATPEDFSVPVAAEVHERYAAQMNRIGAVVGRHGVRFAIHTDAYSICCRNEDVATVLSLTDPTTVQLCPDAGHITIDGGDASLVLRDHIDRVPTMHWKDCAGPVDGHSLRGDRKERHAAVVRNFRILGSGIVNWERWMQVLERHEWTGWANAELDSSVNPISDLEQGLNFYHSQLAPIYPALAEAPR